MINNSLLMTFKTQVQQMEKFRIDWIQFMIYSVVKKYGEAVKTVELVSMALDAKQVFQFGRLMSELGRAQDQAPS